MRRLPHDQAGSQVSIARKRRPVMLGRHRHARHGEPMPALRALVGTGGLAEQHAIIWAGQAVDVVHPEDSVQPRLVRVFDQNRGAVIRVIPPLDFVA